MEELVMKKRLLAVVLASLMAFSVSGNVSAEWKRDDASNWSWSENGSLQIGWKYIEGKWYYFNKDGIMKTGWILDGDTWYYLEPNGGMKTGWLLYEGSWYYLNPNGAMAKGWQWINNSWYYFKLTGEMASDEVIDGYKLTSSGEAVKIDTYLYSDVPTYTAIYGDPVLTQDVTVNDGKFIGIRYIYDYSQEKAIAYQNYIQNLGFSLFESENVGDGGYIRSFMRDDEAIILTYFSVGSLPKTFSVEILVYDN